MIPRFIGIAGGTGAGKSALCTSLQKKYPDRIGLIQLDDYFKPSLDVPRLGDHTNWDHPNSLYLDQLESDLRLLSQGTAVLINTKNEFLNPAYTKKEKRIPVLFSPKPIMLVEGYLVLYKKEIRDMLTTSIWLDVDHTTRWERRVHFKYPEYESEVVVPMHEKFVLPTKKYAQHILNVSPLTADEVLKEAEIVLKDFL